MSKSIKDIPTIITACCYTQFKQSPNKSINIQNVGRLAGNVGAKVKTARILADNVNEFIDEETSL